MFILTFINNMIIYCSGNISKKQIKQIQKMKKVNVKFGVALAIMSLLTVIAFYFEVATNLMFTISMGLSVFIAFAAMMGTYHYCGYGYSTGRFWFWYSSGGGGIIVASIYALGMHLLSEHLANSLLMGLFPSIIPVIGVFLGDCGRVIFKAEPSAI